MNKATYQKAIARSNMSATDKAALLAALGVDAPATTTAPVAEITLPTKAPRVHTLTRGTLRDLKAAGRLPKGWTVDETLAGERTLANGTVEHLTAKQVALVARYAPSTGTVRGICHDRKAAALLAELASL